MDDNQKPQGNDDMTVGSDGAIKPEDTGQKITVNRPAVNDVTPPPAPIVNDEAVDTGTEEVKGQAIQVKTDDNSSQVPVNDLASETTSESAPEQSALASPPVENNQPTPQEQTVQEEKISSPEIKDNSQSRVEESTPSSPPTAAPAEVGVAASQMNKAPHRNNKKLAAIVTVVVALILAGTAVYVYLSANNNTESSTAETSQDRSADNTAIEQEVTPATVDDIDQATSEVDQAVNALDEAGDFAEDDLSDSTLGL